MTDINNREVYLEFIPMGQIVKVTAFDTESLTEVSIQGPKNAPEQVLKQNALKRLEYVLKQKGILV